MGNRASNGSNEAEQGWEIEGDPVLSEGAELRVLLRVQEEFTGIVR